MTAIGVLVFLAAYATAAALPGPGLASLIARVLARGLGGIPTYIAGFVVGDLIWFAAAATGLAAIAAAFQPLFILLRFAGAAYLLYIALKLMTSEPVPAEDASALPQSSGNLASFTAGLTLTLGNPKIMIFFMALFPTVLDVKELTLATGLLIASLMAGVLVTILGSYALLANRSRRFFSDRKSVKALNMGTGAVMAGAAIVIVARR